MCVSGNDINVTGTYQLSVTSSVGPDIYEPDSVPKNSSILSTTSQNRSITEGDIDWVRCYIAASDTVLLTATGKFQIAMVLYDRDTTTLLASAPASITNAKIKYRVVSSGYYFIKIFGPGSTASGSYQLSMQTSSSGTLVIPDIYENDNTRSTAKLLPGASVVQARSLTVGDTDWVQLPVAIGRQYSLTFSSSYTTATMYSKDGTILQGPLSTLFLNSSATDTVYVKINSSLSTAVNYSLTLSVLLQPTVPDEYEVDNTKAQAKAKYVGNDSFIQDRTLTAVNSLSDTDWVAFPVFAGKQYTFKTTTSPSTSIYMYLYNNISSNYITSSTSVITYTPTITDTMYLMISRSSGLSAIAYSFSVQGKFNNDNFEPDSIRSKATTITATTSQNHILTPNDTYWVMYTSTPGDSFHVLTNGTTDTKLALFSSSGSMPLIENDDFGIINTNALISWKSPLGGQFHIRVVGKTPAVSGAYMLQVQSILSGTLVAADSFEIDNSKAKARIILDTVVTAEIHSLTMNDTDWVAFPVLAGGQYTVSAYSSSSYLNMHVYTSKDSLLISRVSYTSPSFVYTAPKNDTLFYRVTSASTIARYTMSMSRVAPQGPDLYESDNTKATARKILDPVVSAEVHSLSVNDTDWIAFPVLAGGQYTVSASNSSSSYLYMYVYSSRDSLITSRTSYTSPSFVYTAPKNDTLYYRFTSVSPILRYTFSMSRIAPPAPDLYEIDNTKATARIILDTVVTAEVHSLPLTDTDWVAFPVLAGGQYTVNASSSSSSLNMHLYSSKDSLILSRISYTNASIVYTPLKNDTLYYRITSTASIARYTMSMSRVAPISPDLFENDNTKATARIILDSVVTAEVHSLPLRDTDWVAFPVLAGGKYTVSASSSSYLNMYIYNSRDSLILSRLSYLTPTVTYTAQKNDTLYYRITSTSAVQKYTLSMSRVAPPMPDIYETDNSRDLAKVIKLDSLQSHTITMSDTDWVKIEVTAGTPYRVVTAASMSHYVYLYLGSSTSAYTYNYSSSNNLTVTPSTDDTLLVQIRQYSTGLSYTGPYTIKVTQF
jgi:hypothetical protein